MSIKKKSVKDFFFYTLLNHSLDTSTESLLGDGSGISSLTSTGTLKALPKAKQLPGCNIFNCLTISSVILGIILRIYSVSR